MSVPSPPSQDSRAKLWRLHAALLRCHKLLEKAIAKEVEELGDAEVNYETQRKVVKERLCFLISNTQELLKAAGGAAQIPSVDEPEVSIHPH